MRAYLLIVILKPQQISGIKKPDTTYRALLIRSLLETYFESPAALGIAAQR